MEKGHSLVELGIVIGLVGTFCAMLGALLWPFSINSWLVFFDREPSVVWWHGVLLGFCPGVGQIIFPVAVITWVAMLILT